MAFHAIVPLLNVNVKLEPNQQSKTGIGDLNLAAALGYHVSEKFYYVVAFEANATT